MQKGCDKVRENRYKITTKIFSHFTSSFLLYQIKKYETCGGGDINFIEKETFKIGKVPVRILKSESRP